MIEVLTPGRRACARVWYFETGNGVVDFYRVGQTRKGRPRKVPRLSVEGSRAELLQWLDALRDAVDTEVLS